MSGLADKADNALLWVVGIVVVFLLFGVIGTIISTLMFAIKLVIIVAAIGVGVRVATAITGGRRRRELNR
jgi:hypothetical protein